MVFELKSAFHIVYLAELFQTLVVEGDLMVTEASLQKHK